MPRVVRRVVLEVITQDSETTFATRISELAGRALNGTDAMIWSARVVEAQTHTDVRRATSLGLIPESVRASHFEHGTPDEGVTEGENETDVDEFSD
jgi:hypothetical protein